jgi:hypothetical protein
MYADPANVGGSVVIVNLYRFVKIQSKGADQTEPSCFGIVTNLTLLGVPQLEYASTHPQYAAVALGFNPIPLAKKAVVSGWGSSMQKVRPRTAMKKLRSLN